MALSPLRVEPNDAFLRDSANRAWLLRGVNLSGSCKFPKYPVPVPSHIGSDTFLKPCKPDIRAGEGNGVATGEHFKTSNDHASISLQNDSLKLNELNNSHGSSNVNESEERISFVGRPFELEEADEHLARLRHWGFRMIRWVVTWEAIEHQGPGIYDQEFLDYTVKALLKAKEHGFKVMVDFHQDVWSRFSGGSGAPLWTFYAAGLDPSRFAATGAAYVHNTLQENEPLLRMAWLTNYYKLACASMFTLFYAGKILAPQCTFDGGVNIQDYLQSHFLGAIGALVSRIHECRDGDGKNLLEDEVVIGYDSWNEPSCGWIGLERLDILPEQHDMRQGDMPTPLQSLMLGEGLVVHDIATYKLELVGPVKSGSRTVDSSLHPASSQQRVKAWLSAGLRNEYDIKYGIRRDTTFPNAGECLWAQLGVWSVKDRRVLQQDYFARGPSGQDTKSNRSLIQWVPDHWLPFAKRVIEVVRQTHSSAILFLEPPVYVPPPDLRAANDNENDEATSNPLTTNMVYAPHHYDDLVLLTKRYLGWVNIDLLGLSRGRHKSLFGSIVLGKKSTEALFGNQIEEIQKECYARLGQRPVLIGETGLHFDVGLDEANQSGNIKEDDSGQNEKAKQQQAWWKILQRRNSKQASLTSNPKSNPVSTSKQFQQAFDNILSGLDRTLAHYTLWNYTIENDMRYGDGWNGENLSLYSQELSLSSPTTGSGEGDDRYHKLDRGGRAIEQFCRPYPISTVGQPIKIQFDRHAKSFKLWTKSANATSNQTVADVTSAVTEIYVPHFHFRGPEHCDVEVSDGTWEWDQDEQLIRWVYGDKGGETGATCPEHWLAIDLISKRT